MAIGRLAYNRAGMKRKMQRYIMAYLGYFHQHNGRKTGVNRNHLGSRDKLLHLKTVPSYFDDDEKIPKEYYKNFVLHFPEHDSIIIYLN